MMPTTREFLGDSLIKELEGAGFSPQSINAFAKNEYRQRKAAQEEEQRRLLYRADDMKLDGKTKEALLSGEINEQEAKNAQKFEEFGAKKHGFALGAAKTVTGIANTVERVGDFINPFYEGKHDKDGNYIYQNGLEKSLRPKIKNVEKMRDDYEKATGETSWGSRLAEIGTELVGDPINFVGGVGLLSKGSKLAQFGKKTLYFAGTGAASGGVAALGEGKNDEETLKNIGYGAAGGALLGHAIDQGIQGISKLIAKRQASRVANEADAIESAQNSEFLGGERAPINTAEITARKDEPLLHAERSQRDYATKSSPAQIMTAKEFATKEVGLDEGTATNVLKEAMQGKEKSEFIDADSYNDIVKFKNFEIQREYAKAYGERIQTAQTSINNAREQSAIRYADTQKAISEYQKQGMSASAIRELINAKFKPSADEINYTRAYNDGVDVDARLAGQGIFYALEKDIAAYIYTPEQYFARLKSKGYGDEQATEFTHTYVQKNINIAKEYVNEKVANAYESRVQREVADEINSENRININKDGAYRQHPMLRPDEPSIEQGDLKGNLIDKEAIWGGDALSDLSSPRTAKRGSEADATIIPQKGNLINETTKQEDISSLRAKIEQENNIVPIKEFGTNYAEFYHDGKGAIDKLLTEREGQVAGAFYRKELGDIDLVWGKVWQDQKRTLQGYGLAKIKAKHPEVTAEILNDVIKNGQTKIRQNEAIQIEKDGYKVVLKNNWMGKKTSNKWIVTAYEKSGETSSVSSDAFTKGDNLPLTAEVKGDVANLSAYSDEFKGELASSHPPLTNKNIISQKGNLINEEAKNSTLPNGVSSIGDNASGAGGRQGGDEEILRQSGRNTSSASQTKQTAQSDEQMEQRPAFKTDGDTDATASSKQMVEEQGSGASVGGGLRVNSNAHLGSGLVTGTLNSIDEDGNFNPDRFAAGFLVGLVGSKAAVVALKKVAPKFYDNLMNTAKGFSNKGIKEIRSEIEKTNGIVPIKEFGENYAEFYHNGEGAVQKLLAEKQGQVAGAFYRKELGDIDLVWGNEKFGLSHILKRRSEQWGEEKAIKFLSHLDENIKNGDISQAQNGRVAIKTNKTTVVLDNIDENKFVLSAYRDRSNAKSENAKFVQSSDITSKDVEANAKDSSVLLPTDDHIISKITETSSVSSGVFTKRDNLTSAAFERDSAFASRTDFDKTPIKADVKTATPSDSVQGSAAKSPIEHSLDGKGIIQQNEEKVYHSRRIEEIKREHPDVEKELDESIAAMRKESFNDVNFKDNLISKINAKDITTKQLGKSVDLSDKQLAVLKNDIKNADFKVISDSKIYFDKIGRDGDKKRFFIDIAEDGKVRVDGYSKKGIDTIPVRQSALEELAGVGDRARLKNMSFEVKAAYFNELDPIKKEAILKTAELNKLKKAAQSGDNVAVAKFEEFKARNLDENGNIKDGLSLC
nr:MAG TPA: crystallin beta/gamma motif-containing protein [Caudoviricetes sp.]